MPLALPPTIYTGGAPGYRSRAIATQDPSGVRRLLSFDWDAFAGILAAVVALVLHFLHVVEEDVLLSIALVLLALLFVRDLRRDRSHDQLAMEAHETLLRTARIEANLPAPDARLIGPQQLRAASEQFAREASGEMIWFHVCLSMFRPQSLFDTMLRPAIENPHVTSITFVLDHREREAWDRDVVPKIAQCSGRAKVREPLWTEINESISVVFSEMSDGKSECLLSFWGEPFMSHSTARPVPRYIFRVAPGSELVSRLADVERKHRLGSA